MAYKKTPGKRTSSGPNSGHSKKRPSRSDSGASFLGFKRVGGPKRSSDDEFSTPSESGESRPSRFKRPAADAKAAAYRVSDKTGRPPGRPPFKKSGKALEAELLKKIYYELKNTSKLSDSTVKQVMEYFEPAQRKPFKKPRPTASATSRSSLTPNAPVKDKPAGKGRGPAPKRAGTKSNSTSQGGFKSPAKKKFSGPKKPSR